MTSKWPPEFLPMSILQQGFVCKLFLLGEGICIFGEMVFRSLKFTRLDSLHKVLHLLVRSLAKKHHD